MTIDRAEWIDYLLRRDFGALPPPIPENANSFDWKLREASRQRDLRMRGLEDRRPTIERRRAEYQSLSDEHLSAMVQAAKEEAEKQAESLRRHVEAVKAGAWPRWAKKDLWSEAEFAALCCGLIPDERGMPPDPGRTDADMVCIHGANDDIRRGTLSMALEFVSRSDEDTASRMYGTARHYVPAVAVEWAAPRFDTFPEPLLLAVRKRAQTMRRSAASLAAKWPWGQHHTKHLQDIREAAEKYWKNYDPSDHTTAPTNEEVAGWLIDRGVSKNIAQAIASILRADDLPPGRRR